MPVHFWVVADLRSIRYPIADADSGGWLGGYYSRRPASISSRSQLPVLIPRKRMSLSWPFCTDCDLAVLHVPWWQATLDKPLWTRAVICRVFIEYPWRTSYWLCIVKLSHSFHRENLKVSSWYHKFNLPIVTDLGNLEHYQSMIDLYEKWTKLCPLYNSNLSQYLLRGNRATKKSRGQAADFFYASISLGMSSISKTQ